MVHVVNVCQYLLDNWQNAIIGGIMIACSVIFLTGMAKMFGLGKIKNKHLKKAVLYFGSLVMVLPSTALYFLIEGISFACYWWGCLFVGVLTTVTYVLYENSGFRALIHSVGEKTVGRVFGVLYLALKERWGNAETIHQLSLTTEELKNEVRRNLKGRSKEDNDLDNL